MLRNFKNPFAMLAGFSQDSKSTCATSKERVMVVGLQTLVHISSSEAKSKSNVVLKSSMKRVNHRHLPAAASSSATTIESYCYLKSCYLCNKKLRLDNDIYMYRGDQGFCSMECRNRRIVLDEMKELEISKQMRKSYRHCSASGRHETRRLLEDLRQRRNPVSHQKHWAIVS